MVVPSTNVGFSSIQTEFGGSNPISLSEYYSGGPLVPSEVLHQMDLFLHQVKYL